jgi:hypothetical protein
MEANRPDPVDVNQFAVGQGKISVMSEVGWADRHNTGSP